MRRKRCKPNYAVKVLDYQTWITPNWRSSTGSLRQPHGASASTPSISSLRGIARRASPSIGLSSYVAGCTWNRLVWPRILSTSSSRAVRRLVHDRRQRAEGEDVGRAEARVADGRQGSSE